MNKFFFVMAIGMLLAVESQAVANVAVVNNFVDVVGELISSKMTVIGITLVMIFSGIMAWKNASIAPLGWGAVASLAIGGSGSIGSSLKALKF